jgi:membrane protease YdiL (CAAX protease family)
LTAGGRGSFPPRGGAAADVRAEAGDGGEVASVAAPTWRERLKLAGVALAWLLLTKHLVWLGDRYVPGDWKARMSFQSFQIACQAMTLSVGLALAALLLRSAGARLGIRRPRALELVATALVAPLVFVVSSIIALEIALPTLLVELQTRGASASAQNAGEFGRSLVRTPLFVTLLWGGVLAAVGEELLFRGALWSAAHELTAPLFAAVGWTGRARAIALWSLRSGGVATLFSAGVFGWMHADLPGGVGVVRAVSTTCLGLACGLGRQLTGTVWAAILLHFANNLLAIGGSRRWFPSTSTPIFDGVPDALVIAAGAGLVLLAALAIARRRRSAPSIDPVAPP